jgi:hypothetical protein
MTAPNHRSIPRRTRPARWLASALVAVVGLLAAASNVTGHGPDPLVGSGRWSQDQVLKFRWRSSAVPTSAIQAAIRSAAADARASRASQAASYVYDSAGSNLIGYGRGATCGVNGLACFTRTPPTSFTMWLREQGHVFDWGTLKWCQAYVTRPSGCYDAENIALDEFGHVEILDHHVNFASGSDYGDAVVQALSRTYPNAGWNRHAFGRCDVATLQMQYDVRTWAAKYSTCLDLATTLGLTSNVSQVTAGSSVILTATLKVANTSSYAQLALNPLAARVVTLQRRPRGTSAWSTVGTMSAGSAAGTYTRAVQINAATDFRAVFAAPADEGLRASTSAIVTVGVTGGGAPPVSCTDTTGQGCTNAVWPYEIAPSNTYKWSSTIDSCPANGNAVGIVVTVGAYWTPVSVDHGSVAAGTFVSTRSGSFTSSATGVASGGPVFSRMSSTGYFGRTSVGCHLTFSIAWVSGPTPWP